MAFNFCSESGKSVCHLFVTLLMLLYRRKKKLLSSEEIFYEKKCSRPRGRSARCRPCGNRIGQKEKISRITESTPPAIADGVFV
jgi:hypothetical protein